MTFSLSAKSLSKLNGVHPKLVEVVKLAIQLSAVDFVVLEGLRTLERQKQLVAQEASRTMQSRHLTGHAVDLGAWIEGSLRWQTKPYYVINDAMQEAAAKLGVHVRWGGTFPKFFDGPHFELDPKEYPL